MSLFSSPPGSTVAVGDFMLRLLVAWLCGQALGWLYSRSHGVLSYSQNFVHSIVLLSPVVALIMSVVGDSLARAFGLGAALAIVRFRTPVKDSRDTVFLFLSVAIGMAAGSGLLGIAGVSTLALGLGSLFLHWTAYGMRNSEEGMLRLHFAGDDEGKSAIASVLGQYCRSFTLAAVRKSTPESPEEMVYDVNLRQINEGDALVRDLVGMSGVSGVSLLPQARAGES